MKVNIAQNLFRGEEKKTKKGKVKKGKAFVLLHCYKASSDGGKRSPTPNSVAYLKPKIPQGEKLAKDKKTKTGGDEEVKSAMEAIVKARKEANKEKRVGRSEESAAEERRVVDEERKVALVEK
ncbi:glutathione s-transferase t3-like [Hordeum vulgare]|nr:glutathione s-transferase t3-like [Hordeum vulgare]